MFLEGKSVLVTGGTGSMGQVFVRRVLSGELGTPKKVVVFSRDEAKQHNMRIDYLHKKVATDEVIYRNFMNTLQFKIGDVRDYHDVCSALQGIDVVINAAALKQVPSCEYFPEQAIRTNCLGAINISQAIAELRLPVHTVVGISTDKAAKPVNVMGITKALQERIFIAANIKAPETRFMCVRYGNVLASRGSVIPLFLHQISAGGPVTVTVPEMSRFLLSLNQAVDTIFAALKYGTSGEIFIPQTRSATVINLAKAMIRGRNIEVKISGIRPGEKMHEVLISDEEAPFVTARNGFYVIGSMLPELCVPPSEENRVLSSEYSSRDQVLDLEETYALLEKYELLPEQRGISDTQPEFLK